MSRDWRKKLNALRKVKTEKRELIGWDGAVNVIEYLIGGDRSHGYNEALDDMVEIINQVRRETAEKSKAEIELLRDVAKQVGKVMGNGTFRVETINESILWKMLQRVGIELPIEKELRDIEKDWDKYLSNIKG